MSTASPSDDSPVDPFAAPAEQAPDSGLGMIMTGGFMLAMFWVIYLGVANNLIPAYRIQNAYVQTEATVLETVLEVGRGNKGSEIYHPKVRLRYDVAGQIREEWCRLDWAMAYGNRERAESDLRGYPVGGQVAAWYDPARPGQVVLTQDAGHATGWIMVGIGLFFPVLLIGFPFLFLLLTARKHWFVLEQSTGRVVGGEIREVPSGGEEPAYRPVLLVEYDCGSTPRPGTIAGNDHLKRAAAEKELHALLSAYPVGEERAIWFDPHDRDDPTFEVMTFASFLAAGALVLFWPVWSVLAGIQQFGRWVWWNLTVRRSGPARQVPPGRRVLLIVAALVTIGLCIRFVFWQDYKIYFEFEPVMGKVISADAHHRFDDVYEPRVRFSYVIDGHYYERSTWEGWHSAKSMTEPEAKAAAEVYKPGADVLVWYDPDVPLRASLKRYARWYLYPILLPPLWLLLAQTRRLLSRE